MITRMKTLVCDGFGGTRCSSGAHEHFARSTKYEDISRWCRDNSWKVRRVGPSTYRHTCETCECRRKGLSDDFRDRLHA